MTQPHANAATADIFGINLFRELLTILIAAFERQFDRDSQTCIARLLTRRELRKLGAWPFDYFADALKIALGDLKEADADADARLCKAHLPGGLNKRPIRQAQAHMH